MHWPRRITWTRQGYSDLNCPFVKQTVKDISVRLQFSGGSRPWDKGKGGLKKNFLALWTSDWSKKRGAGGPPGLLPWIRHCSCVSIINYWDQLCGLQPSFVPTQSYYSCFCLAKQWAVVVVISHVEHKVLIVVIVVVFQLLHSFAHTGNKLNIFYHLPYSTQKKK